MRIVTAASSLARPGGTESYLTTVAHELERLGHEVTVTAEELGPVAELAERSGLRVARDPDALPDGCDAVLAHDATTAGTLAERYPDARLVYVAHSDFSDHQIPVLVPGVVDAVVACSDRFAARVRALALDVPIVRMRQPIDTSRFAQNASLPPRPRRALILSNYLNGDRRRALVDAWQAAGVECVQVGEPTGVDPDPRAAIAEADIVVAKGRAALEAMCAARAVYVYDQFGGDGWVTPDSYPAFEADNFAGHATPRPRTHADLTADLDAYHPDMGRLNHELVRLHHGAHHHATALVDVLRGPSSRSAEGTTALAELTRLTRAGWRAEQRIVRLEHETSVLRERAVEAETDASDWRRRALEAEGRLGEARELLATRRAQAGIALGRGLDRLRGRR